MENIPYDPTGRLRPYVGAPVQGYSAPGAPSVVWHRDVGHFLPVVLSVAANLTEVYFKGHAITIPETWWDRLKRRIGLVREVPDLDSDLRHVFDFQLKLYTDAGEGRKEALAQMRGFLDWVDATSQRTQILAVFTHYLWLNLTMYLYLPRELRFGLPDPMPKPYGETELILSVCACLTPGTRRRMLEELEDAGMIPDCINISELKRNVESYAELAERIDSQKGRDAVPRGNPG